jgi:hypothetical protein
MFRLRKTNKIFREATIRFNTETLVHIEDHKLWEQSYRTWRKGTILCPPPKP